MKPKTKDFINTLVSQPKISATDAYLQTHQTTNRASARANASKLLAKTNVQIYLDEQVDAAKRGEFTTLEN